MSNKAQKDILFYSNHCIHCKDIATKIQKKNLRNFFMFVCIDKNFKIPRFVTRVPLIYTMPEKKILIDSKIDQYIDILQNDNNEKDVSPFSLIQTGGDNFSFIDSGGNYDDVANNKDRNDGVKNFTSIGNVGMTHNISQMSQDVSKTSRFDQSVLDDYISKRSNDDEQIKRLLNEVQKV